MSGRLGCAQRYTAVLHWRGGGRVYTAVPELTGVSWGRTLNDISAAQITINKSDASPDCCRLVGSVEPWIHELTIYRDRELVWQGPVLRTIESRAQLTVEAVDVLAWLERLVNTWRITYTASPGSGSDGPGYPPANGRYARPITQIAENIIRLNVVSSPLSVPPDWCQIMDYIVRSDPLLLTRFEKDGSSNTAIWAAYVLDVLDELAKRGLYYTTVGRSIVLTGRTRASDLPVARMTLDHIVGDVEVIRDGTGAATLAFATSQKSNDISEGDTVAVGTPGTEYGRLDVLETVTTDSDSTVDDLEETARAALGGRYPAPIAINVPDSAQLAPEAPVQLHELVCGARIDLTTTQYCTRIGQPFLISDVSGAWDGAQEKLGISLVPLADPYGQILPPGPDTLSGAA